MCRVLSYLGKPILVDELVYKPDNSLITQTHHPKLMSHILNLAGFGLIAWDYHSNVPEKPFLYKTHALPFYDENLKNISSKVSADCIIAHVRGIEYNAKSVVSNQNVHPFKYDNTTIAFAHNGSLVGFEEMRFDIMHYIKRKYRDRIHGTTDSELVYALFLSQLNVNDASLNVSDVFIALIDTLGLLAKVRKKNHIAISSPLNFFISNGNFIVATRFVFDYGHYPSSAYSSPHMGYHSLWYTYGESYGCYGGEYKMRGGDNNAMGSIIIASEPLTEDATTWVEVPEYSFIGADLQNNRITIKSIDIFQ